MEAYDNFFCRILSPCKAVATENRTCDKKNSLNRRKSDSPRKLVRLSPKKPDSLNSKRTRAEPENQLPLKATIKYKTKGCNRRKRLGIVTLLKDWLKSCHKLPVIVDFAWRKRFRAKLSVKTLVADALNQKKASSRKNSSSRSPKSSNTTHTSPTNASQESSLNTSRDSGHNFV